MNQKSSLSGCVVIVVLLVMFACIAGAIGIAALFLTGNADISFQRTDASPSPRSVVTLAPPERTVPSGSPSEFGEGYDPAEWNTTVLVDDFSLQNWRTFSVENGISYGEYQGEQYHFHLEGVQKLLWVTSGEVYASDVIVEADITPTVASSPGNNYGLICRFEDNDNFYLLVYNNEGSAGIAKIKNGDIITLEPFKMAFPALSPHSTHRASAECVGSVLRLYIDGKEVLTAYDNDFIAGDVGFVAGTFNNPPADVLFDNLVVRTR